MNRSFDICVVGGGVAGASLAAYLGQSNLQVAVIEKNLKEQDRIVGELLQPGGVEALKKMNLAQVLEGYDAQPLYGYALFKEGENFSIAYPSQDGRQFTGRGLVNGKLVQKLREQMGLQKNVTVIEGVVTDLLKKGDRAVGVSYHDKKTNREQTAEATLTVICDGIFSTFRERLSTPHKEVNGFFMGLLLQDCALPYPHHGHVIIADPSPVLVYPITATECRVLIDFPGEEAPRRTEDLKQYLKTAIAPQLPLSIRKAFMPAVEEGKFKNMPNHRMPANPIKTDGAVLLGDSLNMRHPLTGGGMTVVFNDAYLLGTLLMSIADRSDLMQWNEAADSFYRRRSAQSATINILADALYGVMRSKELKDACFNYLRQGADYSDEPMALLSGISGNSKVLMKHFFAVAAYGTKQIKSPLPSFNSIARSYQMLTDSVKIITPLLKDEGLAALLKTGAK